MKTLLKALLSPTDAAAERAGNAAVAKANPATLSPTLWKLRAKVNELADPGARVEASEAK